MTTMAMTITNMVIYLNVAISYSLFPNLTVISCVVGVTHLTKKHEINKHIRKMMNSFESKSISTIKLNLSMKYLLDIRRSGFFVHKFARKW